MQEHTYSAPHKSFYLNPEDRNRLKFLSEKLNLTQNRIIRELIKSKYLELIKK